MLMHIVQLWYGDIKNYPGEDGGAVELKGNKVVA